MEQKRFTTQPQITDNAQLIAEKRYLKIDSNGKPAETVREMFMRVAKFIAGAENDLSDKKKGYKKPSPAKLEQIENEFFEVQANLEFLSGMSLLDRGKKDLVAACYVMPIRDSIESIYTTLANTVVLHRRGAGIGYDFSEIRPEGERVKTTGREA